MTVLRSNGGDRSDRPLAWALLVRKGKTWRPVRLAAGKVVGRSVDCDVIVQGRRVRGRHAQIRWRDDAPWIEPIGGAHATINGVAIGAFGARLTEGAVLRLDATATLVVRIRPGGRDWLQVGRLDSSCPRVWRVWVELAMAASRAWPVLLLGESGTGKELAARLLHTLSSRACGPFVAVNCAALPASLLEAELFGAARGAYTGAVSSRPGAFERARGGTLFLDEIGELSPAGQAALLRVLEVGEAQVVGGAVQHVDVRVIAATNVDLSVAAAAGHFRLDLLHRLAVTGTTLPPLRERGADVTLLFEAMLGQPLDKASKRLLQGRRWPGNVRELRNVARRVELACGDSAPTVADVRAALLPMARVEKRPRRDGAERLAAVAQALADNPSVAAAWRASGLPRSTFFRYAARVRDEKVPPPRPRSSSPNRVFDGLQPAASVVEGRLAMA